MTRLLLLLRVSSAEAVSNIQTLAQDHYSGPGPTSAKEKTLALKKFEGSFARNLPIKDKTGWAEPVKTMILNYMNARPRSMQTTLGPSSAGNPCDRVLVAAMSGFEGGPDSNPWLAGVGTAVHAMLADMLERENQLLECDGKDPAWLIEQDLQFNSVALPRGSGDAFHIPAGLVLDWKILGKTTLDDLSKNGASDLYRIQTHIYGLGYHNLGYAVKDVMIVALPRNANPNLNFLQESVFWKEPWNKKLAEDAIARVESLHKKATQLNAVQNLKKLQLVPSKPGKSCYYCPLKNNAIACPDAVKG